MKHMKNILTIILLLLVSVTFLGIMWEKHWKPLSQMTELGYQELTPVAKATKPIILSNGRESTQYYVVVEVDTSDGVKQVYIEIREAYGVNHLLKCLNYYSDKKKVSGYCYYSEEKGKAYFSKDIATAKEYMEKGAKPVVWIVIIVDVILIAIIVLTTILVFSGLPTIPGGKWTKEQLVVCRYNTFSYGTVAVVCIGMGCGMIYLSYSLVTGQESADSIIAGMMMGTLAIVFIALGVLFILFMKNYVLILYPKGFVYRNAIGKTWCFTDEQVEYVSVIRAYRNHSFRIQTKDKNVWINYFCTNYNQAERFVEGKYPDLETYQNDQTKQ